MGKAKDKDDPLQALADSLREKKGVQWSVAKFEIEGEGTRVEYFRGKDFARYFRAHPEKLPPNLQKSGKPVEEQIIDLYQQLLKRGFITKTTRKFKKPKPGKKRLVKWPKTIEPFGPDVSWSEDAFYAWQYDRPTSVWFYVSSFLLVVVVVGACLFPLAPYWMRMTLVYFLMTLLACILSLILVRYVLFAATWIVTGRHFWLFPNMMSEEVGVFEAFKPVVSLEKPDASKYQVLSRIATLVLSAGLVYMLYTHSPDQATMKAGAKKAHDSVLEFLDIYASQGKLTGNSPSNTSKPSAPKQEPVGQKTGKPQQRQRTADGGPKVDL